MVERKLAYKLYKDTNEKPTKDLFIKPLLIGTGFTIGTIGSYFVTPENIPLIRISTGLSFLFVTKSIMNMFRYKKEKENYEEQLKRLEIFKEEVKKIIGKEVNIDVLNVISAFEMVSQDINTINIVYVDGSQLIETIEENSKCIYYDIKEDEKYDITGARNIAYSIKK